MADDHDIAVDFAPASGGRVVVTAKNGSIHWQDRVDPTSARSRAAMTKSLAERFPDLAVDVVEQRLLAHADAQAREDAQPGSVVDANPDPWPTPVDGADLLDEIATVLRRHVILPTWGRESVALWVMHTYAFDAFEYTPRLLIRSPEKRCGKSKLLRLVESLVSRPLACENVSAAAMYRTIAAYRPTLLLDEGDTFLRGRDASEELRGVTNSGFQRGGKVVRCVGDDSEPAAFSTFAPVVIAMIGSPPETVEDRAVAIEMRRRMPGETVERTRPGIPLRQQFAPIVRRCVRWAADHEAGLRLADPTVPAGIDDRAADLWFALLAIADEAGGRWPELARQAALGLMAGRDDASLGVQLLRDVRALFDRETTDRLTSATLVAELNRLEDRPWPEFGRGRGLTPRKLARLLEPYGAKPKPIRFPSGVAKGYAADDLADAWGRYCPADTAGTVTPTQSFPDKDLRRNQSVTGSEAVTDGYGRKSLQGKTCNPVTATAEGGAVEAAGGRP